MIHGPASDVNPARSELAELRVEGVWNAGQRVAYWREEPLEVDGVLDGSWGRWAVEVKTGAVSSADLRGLLEFTRRFPEYRPLLIGDTASRPTPDRIGIPAIAWRTFLLSGPPVAA